MRKWLRWLVAGASLLSIPLLSGAMQPWMPGMPGSEEVGGTGEAISFGRVSIGQTQTAQYTFRVLETSDTAAAVTIDDPCPPFGFSGLASRSMTLHPGQSITFNVTFTPTRAQAYTCSFVIRAAGGYPVQEMETVVYLSGQGVPAGEDSSETPGSTVPGFPFQLPSMQPSVSTIVAEGISSVTESNGEFEVSFTPGTTVTGRLSESDGSVLGNREFRLTPTTDGYEIAVPEYVTIVAEPVSRISFFGMESIDLGLVHLDSSACPCCSIIIEARMCCNPVDYVETSTAYESQSVRIRVEYCEQAEELGDIDPSTLPLTGTGGVLVNPGLVPPPPVDTKPRQIGVTAISLNGESLFEGDGEFEKTINAGRLEPGAYIVRVAIGRVNGKKCFCEKAFEVLSCPAMPGKPERVIAPENGCTPFRVTYDMRFPNEMDEICDLWLQYPDIHFMRRVDALPYADTLSTLDSCIPRTVEAQFLVDTRNCCSYTFDVDPFIVRPTFRMAEDCVCLRTLPTADGTLTAQIVFDWKADTAERQSCIMCKNYNVQIDWGDGKTSNASEVIGISPDNPNESTVTHQYGTDSQSAEHRSGFDITVNISGDCGSLRKTFSTGCPLPSSLISKDNFDPFLTQAGYVTGFQDICVLVNNLISVFESVGKSQGTTTICSVLLSVQAKGLNMEGYRNFDSLGFADGIAGGVFENPHTGAETGTRQWRFYQSPDSSAKLVYMPGESPYFELVMLQGGCDDCPVFPTYRIVSSLTDSQSERRAEEARESLAGSSGEQEPILTREGVTSVLLEIGLCCRPDTCEAK